MKQSATVAELKLIAQMVAGDESAGEVFVARYGRLITFCVVRAGVPPAEREDVCQQVYVHLWERDFRRLRSWRGDASLSSFLCSVVARLTTDHARRRVGMREYPCIWEDRDRQSEENGDAIGLGDNRRAAGDGSQVAETVEATLEARWRRAALVRALRSIKERDARLLLLRHRDGLSYREIATVLGWTVNHVGVALLNAERRCRDVLLADAPELFGEFSVVPRNCKKYALYSVR